MGLKQILGKTKEYLKIPSVVRFEWAFMRHLIEDFSIPGYELKQGKGYLVVRKANKPSSKVVSAHIDRHGFIVNQDWKSVV